AEAGTRRHHAAHRVNDAASKTGPRPMLNNLELGGAESRFVRHRPHFHRYTPFMGDLSTAKGKASGVTGYLERGVTASDSEGAGPSPRSERENAFVFDWNEVNRKGRLT